MFSKLNVVALCVVLFAVVDSRVIMVQDTPITPEGISMKILLKEDRDASGRPVASIKLILDDDKIPPPAPHQPPAPEDTAEDHFKSISRTNEVIPDFDDRFGIGNGQCPVGTVWRGRRCWPIGG